FCCLMSRRPRLSTLFPYTTLCRSLRGANPVVYAEDAERLVISGFSWPDNTVRTYAGAPYATVDRVGSGKIILFAEDPLFRGVWDGPGLLLMNAIYLGAPARPGAE